MVLTNRRTGPRGLLHEISEGTHGHACRLPRGGLLSGRSRDLRHHAEDRQAVGRGGAGGPRPGSTPVGRHNYDGVGDLVAETVARTKGRISAKRLLPVATAAGYEGSARNFRRLVAEAKAAVADRRTTGVGGPGCGHPGDMVVFDWGEIGPLYRLLRRGGLEPVCASSPSPTTWEPTPP